MAPGNGRYRLAQALVLARFGPVIVAAARQSQHSATRRHRVIFAERLH